MESMDGHLGISDYYTFSDESGHEDLIVGLKSSSEPFSTTGLKNCPMCRGPLRNINRYGRIVRRAWIDEATKKFILWANTQFVPLVARMEQKETELRERRKEGRAPVQQVSSTLESSCLEPIELKGSRDQQIMGITNCIGLEAGYKSILKLRKEIKQFLRKVDEAEQPFSRIYDLVQDARRHRGVNTEIFCEPDVLQVRNRLLTTVLLLRCDYAILLEFLTTLRGTASEVHPRISRDLRINLNTNRKDCEALINESQSREQPANVVEGLLYWTRFVALERGRSETESDMSELLIQARVHLQRAKEVCKEFPGQNAGMLAEIEDVEKMLRDSTFYMPVSNEEKATVYAAMSRDFLGTGHWYYCANGHPFTIGECGMPMQTSQCPQCGSPVGGQDHQAVEGVTRATDLEAQFGGLAT